MRTVIIILCCVFVLLVLFTWIFTIQLKKLGPLYVNLIEDGDYVKMVISDIDNRNKILLPIFLRLFIVLNIYLSFINSYIMVILKHSLYMFYSIYRYCEYNHEY